MEQDGHCVSGPPPVVEPFKSDPDVGNVELINLRVSMTNSITRLLDPAISPRLKPGHIRSGDEMSPIPLWFQGANSDVEQKTVKVQVMVASVSEPARAAMEGFDGILGLKSLLEYNRTSI